ncbi:hypothetical protein GS495_16625 [Rhodococcus hoagii]|nr:hypothetical protein [Prescottella equi]
MPPTLKGFEDALRDRGHDGVAEALISRHNQRMERIAGVGDMMQRIAIPLLTSYLPLSVAAEGLGAHSGRFPSHSGRTWVEHLAWGLDSTASAVRLLLSLQPIGASIIARTQMERWSSNLEFNTGVTQQSGEDTASWYIRLWSSPGALPLNLSYTVGDLFGSMSELLHGRGPLMPLVWLDIEHINDAPSSEHVRLMEVIADAVTVSLNHVHTGLLSAAHSKGREAMVQNIDSVPLILPTDGWLPDLKACIWPMVPTAFQQPAFEYQLGALASGRERVASALRSNRKPAEPPELWPILGFGSHRYRALTTASVAFEYERESLGDRFGSHSIEETETEAVLAGEMAAMLATWLREDPGSRSAADAFAVCASALRSAEWLWLEDDSRGMGCLRCVIEQIARARTWRRNPTRAAKIEGNPNSTPRDWIEAAGLRRLNLLNRALGEFAHGSARANWNIAQDALVALQKHAETDDHAKYTGRTHALKVSIFIVSTECAAWVDSFDSPLGEAYRKVIRIDEAQADRALEELMSRAWEKRGTPVR